ncbi:MAG TPA: prepilin-type N-terminal cleavage/methylation domain-containing protein [Steroidobacteraceae bacterium]|nr:prepilin-type N-terminal cleavage/methylation domain-containing protein [Steroidobacteraceae bacterium]
MTDPVVRARGFTLLELMMVVAIVAILGSLAVSSYRLYIMRSQAAQTLTDYGHIRTVVAVETQADGANNLQEDSVAGAVPPKLQGQLDNREFNGLDGQQLQLVVAPAGTFASFPDQDVYALVDTAPGVLGELRLRVLRQALPHAAGDKIWVSPNELIWPLDPGAGGATAVVTTPATPGVGSSGSSASTSTSGSSGTTTAGGSSGSTSGSGGSPLGSSSSGSSSTSSSSGSSPAGSSSGTTAAASSSGSSGSGPASSGSSTPGTGGTTVSGTTTSNGSTYTANVEICVGAASGGPLTGYNNINVVYQVTTMYSTFQENLQISSSTGCVSKSYPGQPDGGTVQIQVLNVINYTVSGNTTPLWNGVTPSLTLMTP